MLVRLLQNIRIPHDTEPLINTSQSIHTSNDTTVLLAPDYNVIYQYNKYPHIHFGKTVIDGFIREIEPTLKNSCFEPLTTIPQIINDLCSDYFYYEYDGIFQIGFKLYQRSQLNKLIFTEKKLITLLKKYFYGFKKLTDKQLVCYTNLLLKTEFIRSVNTSPHYPFSYQKYEIHATYVAVTHLFDIDYHRSKWGKYSKIKIYIDSSKKWYQGTVTKIITQNKLKIKYQTNKNKTRCKTISRWSYCVQDRDM